MMKEIHTCQGSGGTAQQGNCEKCSLRNPPQMPAGFVFVKAHESEACKVHEDEVKNDKVLNQCSGRSFMFIEIITKLGT